ncbi:hypothetical protein KFE25_012149 [Diacronema lutheri]|uniref:Inositol phosphatase domain-containing protein n=1 Tax=Diacronema lutheri TaxID=2081491 RepID=A0A8J5XDB2_DIALT|nr:hypothetical protein KFE25_012149 [Diacronema lutheri]
MSAQPSASLSRRLTVLEVGLAAARALVTPADGAMLGIWLLTFVNHWNFEQERLVVLTEHALLRIKYNFLAQRVEKYTRLRLAAIESITLGRVRFASQSLAEGLQALSRGAAVARPGVRITLRGEQLSKWDRWNPRSAKMGERTLIFCSHMESGDGAPLIEPLESVDDFQNALQRALNGVEGMAVVPVVSDIVLDSLLGIPALVYNENRLGEWRTRGSIAF